MRNSLFCGLMLLALQLAGQGTALSTINLKGDLIVFHAGSLAVPFKEISRAFMEKYPDVRVLLESAGSVASARKITDLHRPCDILASADRVVIDQLLVPQYTDMNIPFALNELVIASLPGSATRKIDSGNWYKVLADPGIRYGRSDPNSDPCGYRTVMTLQLAEMHYGIPNLEHRLLHKDQRYIRPKEVDLFALLESETVDYIFIYRSVAEQHRLAYLILPDEINLKDPGLTDWYATASVEINGKKPGEKITLHGEPMVYGVTVLRDAPNKEAADAFLQFLLDPEKGVRIMERNDQPAYPNPSTP